MLIHKIYFHEAEDVQSSEDRYFAGGQPLLPADMALPTCQLCSAELSFFFQVAFPEGHVWEGYTLAVFACTNYHPADQIIPKRIREPSTDFDIPSDFFEDYETTYRFIVFPTSYAPRRYDYIERVS